MSDEPAKVRFKGTPSQRAFVKCTAAKVLGYGGFGSGKTLALCIRIFRAANHPGARVGLVRKHLSTLKATTLKTLLQGDGSTPPVLPYGSYTHRKIERTLTLASGGEIVYFGLDDPGKIGSYNLSGCGIDQAEELSDEEWHAVVGRIRVVGEWGRPSLFAVCNPGPPSHHLAKRFGLALDYKPMTGHEAIHIPTLENTHTDPSYHESLKQWTGVRYRRYVLGEWVGAEGLIYDTWERGRMCIERPPLNIARVVVGVDDGTRNPFAAVRVSLDGEGAAHVEREVYARGLGSAEKVAAIQGLAAGAERIVVDPSAAGLIDECRSAELPALGANNDVLAGIARVHDRFRLGLLTVDPSCSNLMREIETYEWNDRALKDAPAKEHDHACDALRYAVAELDKRGGTLVAVGVGDVDKPKVKTFAELREDPDFGFEDF